MALPNDVAGEISESLKISEDLMDKTPKPVRKTIKERNRARRVEAMSLRLAGLSFEQIGDRLGIQAASVYKMVSTSLRTAETTAADQMRGIEGQRLDRAQAAIWTRVLEGDLNATGVFLRLSERRARLFGLDAPTTVRIDLQVRQDMEVALTELENVVLGEVVEDESDSVGQTNGAITTGHGG